MSLALAAVYFCIQPIRPTSTIIVQRVEQQIFPETDEIISDPPVSTTFSFISYLEAWNANIVAVSIQKLNLDVLVAPVPAKFGVAATAGDEELLAHVTHFQGANGYAFGPRALQPSSSAGVYIQEPLNSLGRMYVRVRVSAVC